ncbi:MAG TPA: hypothetical protein VMG08_09785 [Allosphingosinicella sp.]|nr:hypothetical protein [Allosphingosinicella sp.]
MTALAHVPAGYTHYAKRAVPRGLVETPGARLKYYHVERAGEPVPDSVDALARAVLAGDPAFAFADDLGFCLLHRCGADFHFLLPTVWRGANEAWEAVWYRHGDMPAFAPFDPAYPGTPQALGAAPPRPTFCVWELGVVAHEAAAWSRFLASPRGDAALRAWLDDMFAGDV